MKKMMHVFVYLLLSVAAWADFQVAGVSFVPPTGWQSVPASSSMRAGQWRVPALKGGEVGEVVVFYFGQGQGGDAAANLDRWRNQVTTPQGAPVQGEVTTRESDGLKITRLVSFGTYSGMSMMPGVPSAPKAGYGLIGVVVESGQGNVFIRLTGPEALVKSQMTVLEQMLRSVKRVAAAGTKS